jgi:peptidoglycan-N-acetylglucosamine deacetylase
MNLLTFDIEDWYHINYPVVDFSVFDQQEDHQNLLEKTRKLTDFCNSRGIQGTFFVLGRLLEKNPSIGEWIVGQGHELALHGLEHDLLTNQHADQFKKDLDRAVQFFYRITGSHPLGFRAPSWSINGINLWVLEILDSFGFSYDASIFPFKNFLYGYPSAPSEPFFPVIREKQLRLLEVPVSIFRVGPGRIPYSGGVYFNLLPFAMVRSIVNRQTRQGKASLFYFHPWDLWKRSPEQLRQLKARWVSFHFGDTLQKFERLLNAFPMGSLSGNLEDLKNRARPARIGGPR